MVGSNSTKWERIIQNQQFREFHTVKWRFHFGWWFVLTIFSFMLPLGSAYLPDVFRQKVIGTVNFAYIFVLAQILICMSMSLVYYFWANKLDQRLDSLIRDLQVKEK